MFNADESVIKWPRLTTDINASTSSASSSGDPGTSNQQSDNSHEVEPSNSLMRLNDDCLQHIFNYLDDEKDWCRLTDVCIRLRSIAEQAFRKRYNGKNFDDWKFSKSLFRRVLFKFGHLITSLCVGGSLSRKLDRTMIKYLPNLTDLQLAHTKIDSDGVLRILCGRLKNLNIYECEFAGNTSTLFANCSKLEYLCLSYSRMDFNIDSIAKEFPNLVGFYFTSCYPHNFKGFRNFLTQNPQLQQLTICVTDKRYFSAIAKLATHLKVLEIRFSKMAFPLKTEDLLPISKLTKLKEFVFRRRFEEANFVPLLLMKAFLRENVALEHLHLSNININVDVKTITKLKTLRSLQLSGLECDSDKDLISLATELPLLTELTLRFKYSDNHGNTIYRPTLVTLLKEIVKAAKRLDLICLSENPSFKIDLTDYEQLLEATSNRLNENKLTIEIDGCNITQMVNVPRDIQEKNKHQLEITSSIARL